MLKLAVPALLALSLVACKKADAPAAPDAGTTATPAAASADSVGIAECDEYLNKVQTCVNSKMPDAQKPAVTAALNASRASWKQANAQPAAHDSLVNACKQALATAKQSYGAMGCSF
jgi:hypothetical protein